MIRHQVPASQLTTLQTGGPVATVVDVGNEAELLAALANYPDAVCIGAGSNLLISDHGFDGTIIRAYSATPSDDLRFDDSATVRVGACIDWDVLVKSAVDHGRQGLESTSGVPGSLGGAVVQNLGAYGQEIADVVVAVNAWDTVTQSGRRFTKDECAFEYRSSRFKHDDTRHFVITSAELSFDETPTALPRYGDVSVLLQQRAGDGPYALAQIRSAVLDVRRTKGMLVGASLPSAGSFFTNPIVDNQQSESLRNMGFNLLGRDSGKTLVAAAALIEAAGYRRGFRLGNAGLSEMHVLALVNAGGASAADIITLARRVRNDVQQKFGVVLKPEPVLLGFEQNPFD